MNEKLYEITDLTKIYENEATQKVLKNLNFHLESGKFSVIMGPSGVGKSTLLNLLGLIDKPTAGEIKFQGESTAQLSEQEKSKIRRQKIGFIFQFHHLFDELTALENVMVPLLLNNKPKKKARKRGRELLSDLGIYDKKNTKPTKLSGGEKQRIAIGRAIIHHPDVVLGDEISGNLDTNTSIQIINLLQKIRKKYFTSLIIASHDQLIAGEADEILTLQHGSLAKEEKNEIKT